MQFTLPSGEKPEISVFTNDQQRALVQASYRHRYGVFIRLDLCTGLRMGELLALKWEDIDFSTAQLHVRRTINRLAKYEAHDGENKTEIVFGTPKTKNSRRTIPLTRTMADELARWKQQQAQDKIRAGDKYTDDGFIVTNEFGHYFEQKTFKDYYDRLLKDADIGHFTFHALRHTFATRALERGMDYKTLSAILGHYSVAFTMDTYVHSMDEHKRREMDKMNDMFGMQYSISVENRPYPVLCTLSPDGCTAHVPDFPKITFLACCMCRGGHWPPAGLAQQRVFREVFSQTNGHGRAMLAPTRVFLQPEKKLQAGNLSACNFFIPRRGSFSPFPAFYCPASAICSRVMGSS